MNDIFFDSDSKTTGIQINASSGVMVIRIDVVYQIIADDRARLDAEGINTPAVAQRIFHHVVNVIELNDITIGRVRIVEPLPAHGDPGIKQIINFIMGHVVLGA